MTDVAALMDAPDGATRAGDEFHRAENWVRCPSCGLDSPADAGQCFDCGATLAGGR